MQINYIQFFSKIPQFERNLLGRNCFCILSYSDFNLDLIGPKNKSNRKLGYHTSMLYSKFHQDKIIQTEIIDRKCFFPILTNPLFVAAHPPAPTQARTLAILHAYNQDFKPSK